MMQQQRPWRHEPTLEIFWGTDKMPGRSGHGPKSYLHLAP